MGFEVVFVFASSPPNTICDPPESLSYSTYPRQSLSQLANSRSDIRLRPGPSKRTTHEPVVNSLCYPTVKAKLRPFHSLRLNTSLSTPAAHREPYTGGGGFFLGKIMTGLARYVKISPVTVLCRVESHRIASHRTAHFTLWLFLYLFLTTQRKGGNFQGEEDKRIRNTVQIFCCPFYYSCAFFVPPGLPLDLFPWISFKPAKHMADPTSL